MKRLPFLVFMLFINSASFSQVWIDYGAAWHYDFWNIGVGGFFKYEYASDTVIDGHNCQKITSESYVFTYNQAGEIVLTAHNYYPSNFTYVSGDTVFYRNNDAFFILFNFGAAIGDQWVISTVNTGGPCGDTSRLEVTGKGVMTINDLPYRYITVQPTPNSSVGLSGTYIERFGNVSGEFAPFQQLFPTFFQCESMPGIVEWDFVRFKCYQDASFNMYNPSGEDCEYYLTYLDISQAKANEKLFYPNPTKGLLHLTDNWNAEKDVEVFNGRGSLVKRLHIAAEESVVDVSDLVSGIYFLKIRDTSNEVRIVKVIKE